MVRKLLFCHWLLAAMLGAASLGACTPQLRASEEDSCKSDSDCDHSEYCDRGTCRKIGR